MGVTATPTFTLQVCSIAQQLQALQNVKPVGQFFYFTFFYWGPPVRHHCSFFLFDCSTKTDDNTGLNLFCNCLLAIPIMQYLRLEGAVLHPKCFKRKQTQYVGCHFGVLNLSSEVSLNKNLFGKQCDCGPIAI